MSAAGGTLLAKISYRSIITIFEEIAEELMDNWIS